MDPMSDTEPTRQLTTLTLTLQSHLTPERWLRVEARARERVQILDDIAAAVNGGASERGSLTEIAPGVHWSTYRNWKRLAREREGEPWERQLDVRNPPEPIQIRDDVRAAACLLRRLSPSIKAEDAQQHLIAQYGQMGAISATSLKRIWKEAGLQQPRGGHRASGTSDSVSRLSGGAGLALLAAAAAETGIVDALGAAVLEGAESLTKETEQQQRNENTEDARRDGRGRITAAYNRAVRGDGPRDPRLDSDAVKRARRPPKSASLLESKPETIGAKLFAIGASPLLTERRGFDGLEGPSGSWLAALGGHAYADTTLDKFLAELALVDAGEDLWRVHGQQWAQLTAPWREDEEAPWWLRYVVYVDGTQDPYWTHQFAASGKVSRVGRVMPCLARVALMGGPGVPLWVETYAGSVSLKKELLPFLARAREVLGDGEVGRLTVVDAEMATIPLLKELSSRPDEWFVTVLKGGAAAAARRTEAGDWHDFRKSDSLREVAVHFEGEGLKLRGVEMIRKGSRNPTTTLFVTDASQEELTLEEVAESYLSRWPHQEQRFRDGRNGIGLEKSHGYGGELVQHIALATKQETAARQVERAGSRVEQAAELERRAQAQLDAAQRGGRKTARQLLQAAQRASREAARKLGQAEREQQRLATLPREIYVRDTGRDSIVTCAKLTVLMLLEFVLKEYLGGLRMEPRTFIELFVHTPVTIRESKRELHFELETNPRSPVSDQRLRAACAEINRRQLKRSGKRMRFTVAEAGP